LKDLGFGFWKWRLRRCWGLFKVVPRWLQQHGSDLVNFELLNLETFELWVNLDEMDPANNSQQNEG